MAYVLWRVLMTGIRVSEVAGVLWAMGSEQSVQALWANCVELAVLQERRCDLLFIDRSPNMKLLSTIRM
jgi:hypothetical protein